jgi:hypothetical protein
MFKVDVRNNLGYSVSSAAVSILAAQLPYTPNAPNTTFGADGNVVINWTAPNNGGSDITSYTI